MNDGPDTDLEVDQWQERKKRLDALREGIAPGFETAAPKFASPESPLNKSFIDTVSAAFSETLTSNILTAKPSPETLAGMGDPIAQRGDLQPITPDNLEYDVTPKLRPQDYNYLPVVLNAKDDDELSEIQEQIDFKVDVQNTMAARPWLSGFTMFADPIQLGLDVASYKLASLVTLPIMAQRLGRTGVAVRAAQMQKQAPRLYTAGREAYLGAFSGALGTAAHEIIKDGVDDYSNLDELGKQIFFGTAVGMSLGGGIGFLAGKSPRDLINRFKSNYEVNSEIRPAPEPEPEPFITGKVPEKQTILESLSPYNRPDLGLRMQDTTQPSKKPKPKRTPEETKTQAQALKEEALEGGREQRKTWYSDLRKRFMTLGENLVENKNLPNPIKKAARLVSKPFRNMSATNRLVSNVFGTARLAATQLARTGAEFIGSWEGIARPKAAQNRIESLQNRATKLQTELYFLYLKANKIDPETAFTGEKLSLGNTIYDETKFFEDVSRELLYIGTPKEAGRVVDPFVKEAAQKAYNDLYKPFGELLKKYNILEPDADMSNVLNYLNRHWSNDKILNNPEGFVQFLGDYFNDINQQLKSILPNYKQEKDFARGLKRTQKRFQKAADEIKQLQEKVDNTVYDKLNEAADTLRNRAEKINESFDEKIKEIEGKYKKLRSSDAKPGDIQQARRILKEEAQSARKERDQIFKQYDKELKKIDVEIKKAELNRDKEIQAIKSGKRDKDIIEKFKNATRESLQGQNLALEPQEIEEMVTSMEDELEGPAMRELRQNLISEKRSETNIAKDELFTKKEQVYGEQQGLLKLNKETFDQDLKDASKLLEQETKLSGQKQTEKVRNQLLTVQEKMEKKVARIRADHKTYELEKEFAQKSAKIMEPANRLEFLQRKFSKQGLAAFTTKKANEKLAEQYKQAGFTEDQIGAFLRAARKNERDAIKKAKPIDEAQEVADDLMLAYQNAEEHAESLIPREFRSDKTGKPYPIWDETKHPDYAFDNARSVMNKILGHDDEVVFNPIMTKLTGGKSNLFKARGLKMSDDYHGIEDWVERDMRVLSQNFARGVSPAIALTESMQELNEIPIVQQTVKRLQVLNKNIGPEKALDLPYEMQNYKEIPKVIESMMLEEYNTMKQGLSGKELQDLDTNYNKAKADFKDLYKQIEGVFGNGFNINAADASDFVDLVNSAVSTVTNNNIVISMLGDVVTASTRYGMANFIQKGLLPMLRSKEFRDLSSKEAEAMIDASKVALGKIVSNRMSGRNQSIKNSTFGRGVKNLANRIGNITGANAIQDFSEIMTSALSKTNILEMSEKYAKGTISKREIAHMAQHGINKERAKDVYNLWKNHGWLKNGSRGIDPSKLPRLKPDDARAFTYFSDAVDNEVKLLVSRPGVGSLPNFAYTPQGKSVLFLKKWFFAVSNDNFMPAMSRMDRQAFEGFAFLFGMGALQSELRRVYRNEERKEFDMESFVFDALSNSSIFGIYSFGVDIGTASGFLASNGAARFDPMTGIPSIIAGPGVIGFGERMTNILGRLRQIATNDDRQFEYKDANYIASTLIPFYKWAPIASVLRPRMEEYFESKGRKSS